MQEQIDEMFEKARNGDNSAFGFAPSPINAKDYIAYPPAPGAPASVVVPGVGTCPVYEQQGGTCVGYSLAAVLSYLEFKETGKRITFDGSELHHRHVRSYANGMWPNALLEEVRLHGAEAQTSASFSGNYAIGGYAGVPLDPDSILTALSTYGPLQMACWLGNAFQEQWGGANRQDTYLPAPATQDQMGCHAMLIVAAYRDKGVVIQNNWGIYGGLPFEGVPGGFHKVSWEWLAMQGIEAWSVADKSNTALDGWIKNHDNASNIDGFLLVKQPERNAVYAILGETRDWISSQKELYARGLGGRAISVRGKTDAVWGYPVVGQDASDLERAL